MEFEYSCVYNPDFGTEENVEPQLVHMSAAGKDAAELVSLIGVAQGIAELAYSFGNEPVKWFKTGKKGQSKMSIVVPLLCENKDDWRSGFWFLGQMPWRQDSLPAEAVYRLVKLAFRQHCLGHGRPPSNPAEFPSYWSKFRLNDLAPNTAPSLATVVAPDAVRVAPGTLNPSSRSEIEQICRDSKVQGLLICVSENLASVYDGGLNVEMRAALQRWLETIIPAPDAARQVQTEESRNKPRLATPMHVSPEEPGPAAEPDPESALPEGPVPEDSLPAGSEAAEDADAAPESMYDKLGISSLAAFSKNLSNVSFPSMSLSNMQLPQISLSSLSPSSVADWWSAPTKLENVDGAIFWNANVYNLESGRVQYVSAWRRTLYIYTAVFDEPVEHAAANVIFEALSAQLDGFNFAFEPPTRFHYLIHNAEQSTVVSTFPGNVVNNEAIRSLMSACDSEQRVVRLGSTWLYFIRMANGVQAVFGKANVNSQQPSLLGALHSDVQQWLEEYVRKYL